jgi:hypothetical protein
MTLANVVKGRLQQPTRVVIYGPEGVGKSTFGANAPSPIFLGAEDGTGQLDVARLPQPHSFEDALEAVRLLTTEAHDYATLVVDTLDWLEPLVWEHICRRDQQANVEAYGYGKGYVVALDEWRRFLSALERLRQAKRMHLVLVAHSWVKPFKNPMGDDYDRVEMKLHAKAGGLLKEWADAVLFAQYETYAKKDAGTRRVRGVSTGARILMTERTAAYDAKNRYSLPEQLPLSWADYWAGVQAGQVASPAVLREEILRKAEALPEETQVKVRETVTKASENATQLAQINNRINALLSEQTAQQLNPQSTSKQETSR